MTAAICTITAFILIAFGIYHAVGQLASFFNDWQRADDFQDVHSGLHGEN